MVITMTTFSILIFSKKRRKLTSWRLWFNVW